MSQTLCFNDVLFDVIPQNSQPWVRSPQIGEALGYAKGGISIAKLYEAHADEFTDAMTAVVTLPTEGGPQETRIFSLRGCHLLAMFARTPVAKQFRRWVLDVLDKLTEEERARQPLQNTQQLPPDTPITPDQQCTLQAIVRALVEKGGIYANIWSRFNNHFRIARYCQLPQSRLSEAVDYLLRLEVTPRALPGSPLPVNQDKVHLPDEMPAPEDLDKRRARICRELYQLQEKFGCLIDEIRLCLHPGGRLLRLPPESDNAYETLAALNRVATGGAYTARQAIYSAYQIGKGLKFV